MTTQLASSRHLEWALGEWFRAKIAHAIIDDEILVALRLNALAAPEIRAEIQILANALLGPAAGPSRPPLLQRIDNGDPITAADHRKQPVGSWTGLRHQLRACLRLRNGFLRPSRAATGELAGNRRPAMAPELLPIAQAFIRASRCAGLQPTTLRDLVQEARLFSYDNDGIRLLTAIATEPLAHIRAAIANLHPTLRCSA